MSVIICKTLRAIMEKGIKRQICSKADNKKNIHCELQSSWLAKALSGFALIKDILLSRDLNTVDYLTCLTDAWSSLSESLSLLMGKSVISCKHVWKDNWIQFGGSVTWIGTHLVKDPNTPLYWKASGYSIFVDVFFWKAALRTINNWLWKGISSCCFAAPREDENVWNGKHPQKKKSEMYKLIKSQTYAWWKVKLQSMKITTLLPKNLCQLLKIF